MTKYIKLMALVLTLSIANTNASSSTCNVIPDFNTYSTDTYSVTADGEVLSSGLEFNFAMKIACLMQKNNECSFMDECTDELGNDNY